MNWQRMLGLVLLLGTPVAVVALHLHYDPPAKIISSTSRVEGTTHIAEVAVEVERVPLPVFWRRMLLVAFVAGIILFTLSFRARTT